MNRRLNYNKQKSKIYDRFHYNGNMSYWIALRVLDLKHPVTKFEIKEKYRHLVRHYHPDRQTGSNEIMKIINIANDYLEDRI